MDTILAFLQPQLFSTVLLSVTTAWITATITSHSELIKSYREKRGEEYDGATDEMQYCEYMDCDPDEIDSLYDGRSER